MDQLIDSHLVKYNIESSKKKIKRYLKLIHNFVVNQEIELILSIKNSFHRKICHDFILLFDNIYEYKFDDSTTQYTKTIMKPSNVKYYTINDYYLYFDDDFGKPSLSNGIRINADNTISCSNNCTYDFDCKKLGYKNECSKCGSTLYCKRVNIKVSINDIVLHKLIQ